MRKLLLCLFVTIGSITVSISPLQGYHVANAQKPIPPYAKWGTLAMKKAHERYPNADIVDYLHIGRSTGPKTSTERFKLWLKENNKEFGVFINIEFNKQTEKVVKITFRETTR